MRTLDAAVVVPTRNRHSLLLDLLTSLNHLDPLPAEVVIVDDASKHSVADILRTETYGFCLKILRNERCIGPGASRNRGVHYSRGAFILFTDDDCIVAPDWASALVDAFAHNLVRIGGVGGRVLARDRDLYSRYYEYHRILEPRPHDSANPNAIPYLVTANCAVTREWFMRAGGFDERLPDAGGEDAALSMRIAALGGSFVRAENAVIRHRFRRGILDFARTFYRYGLGGRYVVDRYLPLGR